MMMLSQTRLIEVHYWQKKVSAFCKSATLCLEQKSSQFPSPWLCYGWMDLCDKCVSFKSAQGAPAVIYCSFIFESAHAPAVQRSWHLLWVAACDKIPLKRASIRSLGERKKSKK